jgi:hypothetical protein
MAVFSVRYTLRLRKQLNVEHTILVDSTTVDEMNFGLVLRINKLQIKEGMEFSVNAVAACHVVDTWIVRESVFAYLAYWYGFIFNKLKHTLLS